MNVVTYERSSCPAILCLFTLKFQEENIADSFFVLFLRKKNWTVCKRDMIVQPNAHQWKLGFHAKFDPQNIRRAIVTWQFYSITGFHYMHTLQLVCMINFSTPPSWGSITTSKSRRFDWIFFVLWLKSSSYQLFVVRNQQKLAYQILLLPARSFSSLCPCCLAIVCLTVYIFPPSIHCRLLSCQLFPNLD